jgi:hypothetical protein
MAQVRASSRKYTSSDGLIARSGRAHEDPAAMTAPATISRMAGYCVRVLKENPNLTEQQAVKAATLLLRADMARLARKSSEARRVRVAVDRELDASNLEDAGSDGVDAD